MVASNLFLVRSILAPMPVSDSRLTQMALDALEEAAAEARHGPVRRTFGPCGWLWLSLPLAGAMVVDFRAGPLIPTGGISQTFGRTIVAT